MFSTSEIAYIRSQRLARMATVSPRLQPDVAAVVYQFDGECFYVGGLEQEKTLKFRNARTNPRVAFVIDDLESIKPWRPRGIKIHGAADVVERQVELGSPLHLRIRPRVKWVWGIDEPALQGSRAVIRKTVLV
jgi:pyridoxamine 5'-phosphate oxidase family protein